MENHIETVTLLDVLEARDNRYEKQKMLVNTYQKTLIVLTLNIPGPEKNNTRIKKGFKIALNYLIKSLEEKKYRIIYKEQNDKVTGNEGYLIVDQDPESIKRIAIDIEEHHPLGRLLDIDVFSSDMEQMSRGQLGFERRKCFLCDNYAVECSRSKRHTPEELKEVLALLLSKLEAIEIY